MHIGLLAVSSILVCVLSIYIFTKFTSENTEHTEKRNISHDNNENFNTMHWCFGQQSKMCRFQSLCYQPVEDRSQTVTEDVHDFQQLSQAVANLGASLASTLTQAWAQYKH